MSNKPRIYVFCNQCAPEDHMILAIADSGHCLASHVCSSHGWALHDMGVEEDGWKRDLYAAHYPEGYEVEWVESPRSHAGLMAAYQKNQEPTCPDHSHHSSYSDENHCCVCLGCGNLRTGKGEWC